MQTGFQRKCGLWLTAGERARIIRRMRNKGRILASLLFAASAVCVAQAPGAQAPGGVQGQPAVPEPIRQARQLNAQGKPDEALAVYRQFLEQNPTSYEANADVAAAVADEVIRPEGRLHGGAQVPG